MRRSLYLQCHKIMIQYWVVKLYNFDVGASCTSEGFGCFARSISSNSMPLSLSERASLFPVLMSTYEKNAVPMTPMAISIGICTYSSSLSVYARAMAEAAD